MLTAFGVAAGVCACRRKTGDFLSFFGGDTFLLPLGGDGDLLLPVRKLINAAGHAFGGDLPLRAEGVDGESGVDIKNGEDTPLSQPTI